MVFQLIFYDFLFRIKRCQIIQSERFYSDFNNFFVRNSGRAVLFFQKITACFEHDLERYHTHQFRTGNPNSTHSRPFASQFKNLMKRYCSSISDVERKLGNAVFLYVPTNSFHTFQQTGRVNGVSFGIFYYFSGQRISFTLDATFLTNIESDAVCPAGGSGVQIDIIGNQQISGTDCYGTGFSHSFIKFSGAKIGFPFRICKFFWQSLIFTCTTSCQVAAFFFGTGKFVEITRNAEFITNAFA